VVRVSRENQRRVENKIEKEDCSSAAKCPECKRRVRDAGKKWKDEEVWINDTSVETKSGEKLKIRYCSGCGHIYKMNIHTDAMVREEETLIAMQD